ncbi:MAG: Ribosomal silencing factor RsfS [Pseudomonadota bacterium]|jgi:ribosome-associated protein
MTESAAKKDIQKLQRAIVDALEDVKAQEIQVFDTEHLSSLFERVIIASGTSNRQTKALAASVRDKVRNAGFGKPRIEGEDNGEWIIVDCGQAVVHVMQPTIRTYYNLEEIWGGTPVRLKFGAPKPVAATDVKSHIRSTDAKKAAPKKAAAKKTAAQPAAKPKVALKAPAKTAGKTTAKSASQSTVKAAAKTPAKTAAKSTTSKPTVKTVGKPAGKPAAKAAVKKAPARKAVQATTRRKAD